MRNNNIPNFQTEAAFRCSRSHCVLDPGVTHRHIPLGVYKGLLKFTCNTAGGIAAFGNLLGRRNKVTPWLCSGLAAEKDMAAHSSVPLPVVYY